MRYWVLSVGWVGITGGVGAGRRRASGVAVSLPGVRVGEVRATTQCRRSGTSFSPTWALSRRTGRFSDDASTCTATGAGRDLWVMALTKALLFSSGWPVEGDGHAFNLVTFLATHRGTRLLEINDSYVVGGLLRRLPGHVAADYPEVDIQAMPYRDGSFSLVVHSDTLEHVADRAARLRECCRVLRPGGSMVFSVPLRMDRLTASRDGMPPVYHGDTKPPYRSLVHAGLWAGPMGDGARRRVLRTDGRVELESPAGVARSARKLR